MVMAEKVRVVEEGRREEASYLHVARRVALLGFHAAVKGESHIQNDQFNHSLSSKHI